MKQLPSLSVCQLSYSTYTTTTSIYALSLHDALPIYAIRHDVPPRSADDVPDEQELEHGLTIRGGSEHSSLCRQVGTGDRKSTRLNSSHLGISYAVFCLKKKIRSLQTNNIQRSGRSSH